MKKNHYNGEEQRLDIYLSSLLSVSRNQVQKIIREGKIKINGNLEKSGKIITSGDKIEIFTTESNKLSRPRKFVAPEKINKVKIIFEDENIIVVDKDPGMVVYPAAGHESGTLLDALRDKINIPDEERPGVVHRLDKDTSGLIVFAKNEKAEKELKKLIKARKFEKTYLALVWGVVMPEKGTIDIPIKRSEKDRKKMEASTSGRESLTKYEVMRYYQGQTLVRVKIITGRTHQIRVHFAGIGYPVVGDKTYGQKQKGASLERQFLHAHELAFTLFGKKHLFKSELPEELRDYLKLVGEK